MVQAGNFSLGRSGPRLRGVTGRSAERAGVSQLSDFFAREVEHFGQNPIGIRTEFRRRAGAAAKAGMPRQTREHAGAVSIPEPALFQVLAVDELDGISQCGGPDAGADQVGGDGRSDLGAQPGGERVVDRSALIDPLAEAVPAIGDNAGTRRTGCAIADHR